MKKRSTLEEQKASCQQHGHVWAKVPYDGRHWCSWCGVYEEPATQDCDEEWSDQDDRFIQPQIDLDARNTQILDTAYGPEETR